MQVQTRCCPHDQGPLEIFQPKLVCSINAVQLTLDGFPRPSSCQNISIVAPEPRLVIRPHLYERSTVVMTS